MKLADFSLIYGLVMSKFRLPNVDRTKMVQYHSFKAYSLSYS